MSVYALCLLAHIITMFSNSQLIYWCVFQKLKKKKSFVGQHIKLSAGENMAAQQETYCDLPRWLRSVYIGLTRQKNASCWPKMLKM